ncbi:hypothetical protein PYCCODRAFT_1472010 [Trametes coccinea BRFM310]|uniref:F-box domain-containing protein n=1 Tax=Trametes coccinea (strain BRFM310) TaxID=1353009 RepID=A0A1Y2I7S8_TRAC3|nr:hypothetical protein PYCCODRAFT_1472010 [Trametes coccinea BRFM310]
MINLDCLPQEVPQRICKMLNPTTSDDDLGGNSLLVLARTSRAFHEHALNAIWETIPNYSVLVYTLPRDAWSEEARPPELEGKGASTQVSITRPLVTADLVRLKHYAPRVKRISPAYTYHWRSWRPPEPLGSVNEALATLFDTMPGAVMLPNLVELELRQFAHTEEETYKLIRYLPVLFGPKLIDLRYDCSPGNMSSGDAPKYALRRLAKISPNLASFDVRLNYLPLKVISGTLVRLRNLESVETNYRPMSVRALLHLACLPTLYYLCTTLRKVDQDRISATFGSPNGSGYFSQITTLRLNCPGGPGAAIAVIKACRSPFLEAVDIDVTGRYSHARSSDVQAVLAAIATCTGRASVREITVIEGPRAADDAITKATIAPIFDLHELSVVKICTEGPFEIDDDTCRAIAQSWPALEILDLQDIRADSSPAATFTGIVYLAQGCPKLEELCLVFNTDPARLPRLCKSARPGLGFEQLSLTCLDVGRTKVRPEHALGVASILSDIFPLQFDFYHGFFDEGSAHSVISQAGMQPEEILQDATESRQWATVIDAYRKFVAIRSQERKWGHRVGKKPLPPVRLPL